MIEAALCLYGIIAVGVFALARRLSKTHSESTEEMMGCVMAGVFWPIWLIIVAIVYPY